MADKTEVRIKQLEDRVAALEAKLGEQPAAVPAAVAAVGDGEAAG